MAKEKKDKKALKNAKKDIWNNYSASEKKALEKLCLNYRHFLSKCKTERECVKEAVRLAKERNYRDLQDVIAKNETLSAGDKVYAVNKEKAVVLYHIGKEPLEKGMNILGAHIRRVTQQTQVSAPGTNVCLQKERAETAPKPKLLSR